MRTHGAAPAPRSPDGTDQPFMDNLETTFTGLATKNFSAATTFSTSEKSVANQFNLQTEVFGTGATAIGTSDYFTYAGSLTTPGCNENITWFVMRKPMYASPSQILTLTRALAIDQGGMSRGADNRLVQPLNGRVIQASFAAPPTAVIAQTASFTGVTAAQVTAAMQTNIVANVATFLSVPVANVRIVGITDTASATAGRRHLLASGVNVGVAATVPASSAKALNSQLASGLANPTSSLATALKTTTGATGVGLNPVPPVISAAPAVKSAVAAVLAAAVLALAF
jgi:hypothetical protein